MPVEFRASQLAASVNHLRPRSGHHEHSRVTNVELYFDLVFVFASPSSRTACSRI